MDKEKVRAEKERALELHARVRDLASRPPKYGVSPAALETTCTTPMLSHRRSVNGVAISPGRFSRPAPLLIDDRQDMEVYDEHITSSDGEVECRPDSPPAHASKELTELSVEPLSEVARKTAARRVREKRAKEAAGQPDIRRGALHKRGVFSQALANAKTDSANAVRSRAPEAIPPSSNTANRGNITKGARNDVAGCSKVSVGSSRGSLSTALIGGEKGLMLQEARRSLAGLRKAIRCQAEETQEHISKEQENTRRMRWAIQQLESLVKRVMEVRGSIVARKARAKACDCDVETIRQRLVAMKAASIENTLEAEHKIRHRARLEELRAESEAAKAEEGSAMWDVTDQQQSEGNQNPLNAVKELEKEFEEHVIELGEGIGAARKVIQDTLAGMMALVRLPSVTALLEEEGALDEMPLPPCPKEWEHDEYVRTLIPEHARAGITALRAVVDLLAGGDDEDLGDGELNLITRVKSGVADITDSARAIVQHRMELEECTALFEETRLSLQKLPQNRPTQIVATIEERRRAVAKARRAQLEEEEQLRQRRIHAEAEHLLSELPDLDGKNTKALYGERYLKRQEEKRREKCMAEAEERDVARTRQAYDTISELEEANEVAKQEWGHVKHVEGEHAGLVKEMQEICESVVQSCDLGSVMDTTVLFERDETGGKCLDLLKQLTKEQEGYTLALETQVDPDYAGLKRQEFELLRTIGKLESETNAGAAAARRVFVAWAEQDLLHRMSPELTGLNSSSPTKVSTPDRHSQKDDAQSTNLDCSVEKVVTDESFGSVSYAPGPMPTEPQKGTRPAETNDAVVNEDVRGLDPHVVSLSNLLNGVNVLVLDPVGNKGRPRIMSLSSDFARLEFRAGGKRLTESFMKVEHIHRVELKRRADPAPVLMLMTRTGKKEIVLETSDEAGLVMAAIGYLTSQTVSLGYLVTKFKALVKADNSGNAVKPRMLR